MKKKLLRILMLAAAMAALTVCAFAAETSETTQLKAPDSVAWSTTNPGYLTFHVGLPNQNLENQIRVYKEGVTEPVWETSYETSNTSDKGIVSLEEFYLGWLPNDADATTDCNIDGGTYYFTVQTLGDGKWTDSDGKLYTDSEIVKSDNWTYTKPTTVLDTPTNLRWEDGGTAMWNAPKGFEGEYCIAIFFEDSDGKEKATFDISDQGCASFIERTMSRWGVGKYRFAVRALSDDITKTCHSPWSDYSAVLETTQLKTPDSVAWSTTKPGYLTFHAGLPNQNLYNLIYVCKDGGKEGIIETVWTVNYRTTNDEDEGIVSLEDFYLGYLPNDADATDDCNIDSGTYYFTVQTRSDGEMTDSNGKLYTDSEIVASGKWTYTKPATTLTTPTNLRWENGVAKWDAPEGFNGEYYIAIVNKDPDSGKERSTGAVTDLDCTSFIQRTMDRYGAGEYSFAVRALSDDITKTCHSPWSAYSAVYEVEDEDEDGSEGLTKLATPSKLAWSGDGDLSFRAKSPTQNKYAIKIYNAEQDDDPVIQTTMSYDADNKETDRVSTLFRDGYWYDPYYEDHPEETPGDYNMGSGTYYFTIQSLGDGKKYSDSEVATSKTWTYTKPTTALTTPTNLRWENGYAKWDAPDDYEGHYIVNFCYVEADGKKTDVGGVSCALTSGTEELLDDWMLDDKGAGDYCFKVRAVSKDITKTCNSPWSDYSGIYHVGEVSISVRADLNDLLDTYTPTDLETGLTDEEIASLKGDLAEMDTDQLWTAMAADQSGKDGIITRLEELEELVGGPAGVNVSDDVNMDEEKISIVGANLNKWDSDDAPILKIGKADANTVIPELYDNTVAVKFSMKLAAGTATTDSQELDVPVQITMPIPTGINPDFLHILHYHQDGKYEEIDSPYTFKEDDQWYVSFVVTGFSDFALVQAPTVRLNWQTGLLQVACPDKQATQIMAAVYSSSEQMLECKAADVDPKGTASLSLEKLAADTTCRIFRLDKDDQPVGGVIKETPPTQK